jgi:hypothetical protein
MTTRRKWIYMIAALVALQLVTLFLWRWPFA